MKTILRTITFVYLSVLISNIIIGGYFFGTQSAFLLFVLGLSILYFFMPGLLKILSMPTTGPGYIFLSFLLVLVLSYAFTVFVPFFGIQATTISKLTIFGFVLPSKSLTAIWAVVFSSLMLSLSMVYFNWICLNKK